MTRDELETSSARCARPSCPDEGAARERARRTVLAAHADGRAARGTRAAPMLWVAAAALPRRARRHRSATAGRRRRSSASGAAIVKQPARDARAGHASGSSSPRRGRLLVTERRRALRSSRRPASAGGSARWQDATWSPKGLFVGVTSGHTLAAIEPATAPSAGGCARRAGERPALGPGRHPHRLPRRQHAADRLRQRPHDVVAGQDMAAVAPGVAAERDCTRRVGGDSDGTVTVEDADTAKVLNGPVPRRRLGPPARLVGRRPPAADRGRAATAPSTTSPPAPRAARLPAGAGLLAAAFAAAGNRLALAVSTPAARPKSASTASTLLQRPRPRCATSSGPPTAAGCWRAGPQPTNGCSCAPPAAPEQRDRGRQPPLRPRPHHGWCC